MATIEIEIEDYIDEIETEELFYELKRRCSSKRDSSKKNNYYKDLKEEMLFDMTADEILDLLIQNKGLSIIKSEKLKNFIQTL